MIYRGFPRGDQLLFAQRTQTASSGLVCMADAGGGAGLATPRESSRETCPVERPVEAVFETVEFGVRTGRVTMYAGP